MSDLQLSISRSTLTDGSQVFDVVVLDLVNNERVRFPCVDEQAARDFADHLLTSVDNYTLAAVQF